MKVPSLVFLLAITLASCSTAPDTELAGFKRVAASAAQKTDFSLLSRVILIGDTGDIGKLRVGDPPGKKAEDYVSKSLGRWGDAHAAKTSVVFLGDNIYPNGMPPLESGNRSEERKRCEKILLGQINATKARKIFLPGNHDWNNDSDGGYESVLAQQAFIDQHKDKRAEMHPRDARPGPVLVRLAKPTRAGDKGVSLIILDTQWWLSRKKAWRLTNSGDSEEKVAAELSRLLEEAKGDHVIVAAHHPLDSNGPHGGHVGDPSTFFRFIGVRALRPFTGNSQAQSSLRNRDLRRCLRSALSSTHPLIYAGGHDHSLQVLQNPSVDYSIVSGAGSDSKVNPVGKRKNTLFASEHSGFMVVDFSRVAGKSVIELKIVEPSTTEKIEDEIVYQKQIFDLPPPN